MNASPKTVIIAGGASGGHLFPALALGHELKERYHVRVIVVLHPRAERFSEHLPLYDFTYVSLPNITFSLNIVVALKACIKSWKIILHYKPSVVVGFGSAISFPLVCMGWLCGAPTVIHEQNADFGRANKILRFIARKVALSFPPHSHNARSKYIYTGNLIRYDIRTAALKTHTAPSEENNKKFTILVLGGSQGAHFINNITLRMLALIDEKERAGMRIYHIMGERDNLETCTVQYAKLNVEFTVSKFQFDMSACYHAADIIISRAGAGTLFEIMAFGIPAILIPYPYARAHQMQNADYLAKNNAAICLPQRNLTPECLKRSFLELLRDSERCGAMRVASRSLAKLDGAEMLAREVMALCKA